MKKWFWIILILTLLDCVSTAIGIKLGIIEEANPIWENLITAYPIITALFICIIVGILLWLIYQASNQIKWLKWGVFGLLIAKTIIVILHSVDIIDFLKFKEVIT